MLMARQQVYTGNSSYHICTLIPDLVLFAKPAKHDGPEAPDHWIL